MGDTQYKMTWKIIAHHIDVILARVIRSFTCVDVSIAMSVLLWGYLCSYGRTPNNNMSWKIIVHRIGVSLALVILRFTSVDVSIAQGMFFVHMGEKHGNGVENHSPPN